MGGVYTMGNKDTNADSQKVVRVRDQKWEIVEMFLESESFFWFKNQIDYFLYREFSSLIWKKLPPPKVPVPNPKSQFDLSPSYINLLKNDSIPPITQGGGGGGANYVMSSYYFLKYLLKHILMFCRCSAHNFLS